MEDSIGATPIGGGNGSGSGELLRLLELRPEWWSDALCVEYPEISWFPERGEDSRPAKEICRRCLVAEECASFAASQGVQLQGIWGGMSNRERRTARSHRVDVA